MRDAVCNSKPIPLEFTRRVLIPGIAATLTVWLVQSGLSLTNWPMSGGHPAFRIPFTPVYPFLHWDMKVAFAVAGVVAALYGKLVNSSAKQRYLSAMFPGFFEILKWVWMLQFPIAQWIDPARQVYRFATLSVAENAGFWLTHIIIPTAIALGVVALLNRRLYFRVNPDFETARS